MHQILDLVIHGEKKCQVQEVHEKKIYVPKMSKLG